VTAPSQARRFLSVDVLRGLTIAFMILVNDSGDSNHTYAPLLHAEWNGWTPTDMVFPTFLFLVGCSIVFSVDSRLRRGVPRAQLVQQVLRRALLIFVFDLIMAAYPSFHLGSLRIYGVLTRIALCYAAAALFYLLTQRWRWIGALVVTLLVGYWALMRFVPVPGFGVPTVSVPLLDPDGNLTSWMDRGFNSWTQHWLHTGHLYRGTRDPEGSLSTLPAIATSLLGVLAGKLLVREDGVPGRPWYQRASAVFAGGGLLMVLLGLWWGQSFPINKNLWTSSFVLLAAGWSTLGLAVCAWIFDELRAQERHRWVRVLSWPFLVFGSNAIFAYLLSELLVPTLAAIPVHGGGRPSNLLREIYLSVFAKGGSTQNTALLFAIAYVLACFVPTWLLWRRKWFLRV